MSDRLNQLRELIDQDPADPFLHYALALEVARDNLSEGLKRLMEIKETWPDYLPTYYQVAALHVQMGHETRAREWAREGITLATRVGDAWTARELTGLLASLEEDDD